MASWRPIGATDPDGPDEWRFRPVAEVDPAVAAALLDNFAERWLNAADLPAHRLPEASDTVELMVADEWDPPDGTRRLRLRSWYTGETAWLVEWDGSIGVGADWIMVQADLRGAWVHHERELAGETVWDE